MFARLCLLFAAVHAATPKGPYTVDFKLVKHVDVMDTSSQTISVWIPTGEEGQKFPLISYAHGAAGGGWYEPIAYEPLLKGLAEFGYVVIAPEACSFGCADQETLPKDPVGYKNFYKQQLQSLEWARNTTDISASIDFTKGAGVAGHSMGGQATLYSSSEAGHGHDIRAAVMHHAYTHSYPAPTVPFLAFTGIKDHTASPKMTEGFYNAEGASAVKGLVNKVKSNHLEPIFLDYNPMLAPFTAAWFKLFLDKTPYADGLDYHNMIFGSGSNSLCGGGDGDMQTCEVHEATAPMIV